MMLKPGHVLQAINAWAPRSSAYGEGDCCTFVAHVVHYLTGRNYKELVYSSSAEAARIIARHGGLENVVSVALNMPPIELELARVGDPVLWYEHQTGFAMGIKVVNSIAAVAWNGDAPASVISIPLELGLMAWPVHELEAA